MALVKIARYAESFWVKDVDLTAGHELVGVIDNDSFKGDFKVGDRISFSKDCIIDIWNEEANKSQRDLELEKVQKEKV